MRKKKEIVTKPKRAWVGVLTIQEKEGLFFTVTLTQAGPRWLATCTCLENQAQGFCHHVRDVLLGRGNLPDPHQRRLMINVVRRIRGTPLEGALLRYTHEEVEWLRHARQFEEARQRLTKWVKPLHTRPMGRLKVSSAERNGGLQLSAQEDPRLLQHGLSRWCQRTPHS